MTTTRQMHNINGCDMYLNDDATNLRYIDFSCKYLRGVTFEDVDMSYSNFDGADLSGCSFWNTCLENATFIGADLSGVSFVGVNLSNVDFTGANLDGVEFCNKSLLYDVNFKDANISSDTIEIAKIEGCKFN